MQHRTTLSTLMSALIALSTTATGLAVAQGEPDRRDRGSEAAHSNDGRGDQHGGERGAGPRHAYYRGDRLPAESRRRQYVVSDWQSRHLSAPPRGYHWVRTGDDYVLAAIATGVILQLMLAH